MMRIIKHLIFVFSFFMCLSCGLNIEKEIKHPYYLISTDINSDTNISIKLADGNYIGRIPNKVIEYTLEGNYILAKQQDYNYKTSGLDPRVNYYVLKLGVKNAQKMSLIEFKKFISRENILNIEWKKP